MCYAHRLHVTPIKLYNVLWRRHKWQPLHIAFIVAIVLANLQMRRLFIHACSTKNQHLYLSIDWTIYHNNTSGAKSSQLSYDGGGASTFVWEGKQSGKQSHGRWRGVCRGSPMHGGFEGPSSCGSLHLPPHVHSGFTISLIPLAHVMYGKIDN